MPNVRSVESSASQDQNASASPPRLIRLPGLRFAASVISLVFYLSRSDEDIPLVSGLKILLKENLGFTNDENRRP